MIRVVDYGVGNVQAFLTTFKRLGVRADRARSAAEIEDATHLVLAGVGAFDHAMRLLNGSGLRDALEKKVFVESVPLLGVCVGMQMLASRSDEGNLPGLDWVSGHVRAFAGAHEASNLPLPHMGWNDVHPCCESQLFKGFEEPPRFYFLHSYYFDCVERAEVLACASYGLKIDVAVSRRNIFGVQFHPEKSHHYGTQLLKNFSEL